MLDNIGLPYSGINTSYANNGTIGTADVELLCSLNPENHGPTANYVAKLRAELPKRFPGVEFFFQPADIVSQILNFGISAPIDIQFVGEGWTATSPSPRTCWRRSSRCPARWIRTSTSFSTSPRSPDGGPLQGQPTRPDRADVANSLSSR